MLASQNFPKEGPVSGFPMEKDQIIRFGGKTLRVAIVHPWFLAGGGAEGTVALLAQVFPQADIFTLLIDEAQLPAEVRGRKIISPNLHWLPAKYKIYRYLLPFYPFAFESLDLRGYDLVVTSDSCLAKGVLVDQDTIHLCYCHSPMRCLYDQYWDYYYSFPFIARPIFAVVAHYLRMWDTLAAQRVTCIAANSRNIAERIRQYYRRDCEVIYPPVDTEKGYLDSQRGDYYLSVGRLTSPKRVDLLIHACNRLERKLIVVGSGRDLPRLKKLAGPTIEFTGRVSDQELSSLYARCRAFLFASEEDFGIVPVEAQSYGKPVIAYGRGGALESVVDSRTGLFFAEQTVESLSGAILRFEQIEDQFRPQEIKEHSGKFDSSVFKASICRLVQTLFSVKAAQP